MKGTWRNHMREGDDMEGSVSVNDLEQYTVFSIGEQECALSIMEVVEIIRIQTIIDVPGVEDYIVGMINLRGSIIPVIDLRKRYGLSQCPFQKKTRIIVVSDEGENIGLVVDEVMQVTYVNKNNIEPPLEMFNTLEKDCFKGFAKVNEKLIGILNLRKVLYPHLDKEV